MILGTYGVATECVSKDVELEARKSYVVGPCIIVHTAGVYPKSKHDADTLNRSRESVRDSKIHRTRLKQISIGSHVSLRPVGENAYMAECLGILTRKHFAPRSVTRRCLGLGVSSVNRGPGRHCAELKDQPALISCKNTRKSRLH